jgi:hypothetical protein
MMVEEGAEEVMGAPLLLGGLASMRSQLVDSPPAIVHETVNPKSKTTTVNCLRNKEVMKFPKCAFSDYVKRTRIDSVIQ